ncbi:MAG TPA: ABC transporter permease [Bacteroidetes bacterium]|nr:ABC transporter permease [Bacteroidota bacterium]
MSSRAIIVLSWKNVWRNPVRSGIVILSVVVATWSGIFMVGFFNGMTVQFVRDQLQNYTSHIQIHDTRYVDESLPEFTIREADQIINSLQAFDFVTQVTPRTVINGLISSANNNYGVTIEGVRPDLEVQTTAIHSYLIEGEYLTGSLRNPVFIGSDLAQKLAVQLRSRIVLTFQDKQGNITAGAFRIEGIFKTPNKAFNEGNILVRADDLNRLLGDEQAVHEIIVMVDDYMKSEDYALQIQSVLSNEVVVRSWKDLSPMLKYIESSMDISMYLVMVILIIALCFGVINTMLMAVLERTAELGMLRAVGLNKFKSFTMIMLETTFLTMIGSPLGLLLGWSFNAWYGEKGIDLAFFSKGLELYGFNSMIYPELGLTYYLDITLLMLLATVFSAIFPALKALKLNPVEAIRKH